MIPIGWKEYKLGEVCTVIAGQSPESKYYNNAGNGMPFYQGKKEFTNRYIGETTVWTTNVTKVAQKGDILMSVRAPVGPINYATQTCCIGRGLASIRNSELLSQDFLFYFLLNIQDKISGHEGAVFGSINKTEIENLQIIIPSLSEQQRIVDKLDTLFADIEKEKQIVQQNLQNSKELFESELHKLFTENTEGWVEKDFEHCIKPITYTNKIQRKNFLDSGKFPIVSQEDALINGYWNEDVDVFKIDQPVVIFGDHTKKIKYVDFDFVLGADGVKILAPITEIIPKYFYYCLQSIRIRDLGYARHYRLLKEKTIKYPDLRAQKEIVEKLDALHEQTQELEQIYTQQIADLDELKQAILKKAFNGEL